MRSLLALLLGLALTAPGIAGAMDPPDCARLIRQHQHFREMADRAEEAGNEMWAEGMNDHVDMLEDRLDERCPEYTAEKRAFQKALQEVTELLITAGKAALTFFTMGAL